MQVLVKSGELLRVQPMYTNLVITIDHTSGSDVEITVLAGEHTLRPPMYKAKVKL